MLRIIKRLPLPKTVLAIFFLLVQAACALFLPYVTAGIVDKGIAAGNLAYIRQNGALMVGLSVLSLVGALLNTYISAKISYRLGAELRSDVYRKTLGFSKREYDRFGGATIITRNVGDVTQVQNLVEMGLKFLILCPMNLIGGIVMTWLLSPALATVVLATIPLLLLTSFVIYQFASPLYTTMQKLIDRLNLLFREGLSGVKVIRAFNKEEQDYAKYEAVSREYTGKSISAGTIMSVLVPLVTLIISLSTVVIAWIGGQSAAAGTLAVGGIMAAISYSAQILMSFNILSTVILSVPKGQVSARRIHEVLDMEPGISDPAQPVALPAEQPLSFEHVSFRYPGAAKRTLEDISFTVQPGQTLAIIGSTGDGKTSLVNLISRLYDVEEGCIRIGGVDIRRLSQSDLHSAVSVAPQKSTLFMGTIRENLHMAKPDATDEEMWAALEIADAKDFVKRAGLGLDSVVERGGGNFSGGQKQRLCIARTILKDAGLYIFDDSFSALDFKTDAAVRAAVKPRLQNVVTVIVAQRISTVMEADLIAVLDNGRLAGLGTHAELNTNNPVYREIVRSQQYKEAVA